MRTITITGKVPSKSNQYKIILLKKKGGKQYPSISKSENVKLYENDFWFQLPDDIRGMNIKSDFGIFLLVYYRENRSDLDGSFKIILDCLQQNKVIKNDRSNRLIFAEKIIGDEDKIQFAILNKREFYKEVSRYCESQNNEYNLFEE